MSNQENDEKVKKINTEKILDLIGSNKKYQYLVALSIALIAFVTQYCEYNIPIMTTMPIVNVKEIKTNIEKFEVELKTEWCNEDKYSFIILPDKSFHSWTYEYEFYCDSLKNSFMNNAIFSGEVIGILLMQVYFHYKSREFSIKMGTILLGLSCLIIFINNYYSLLFMTVLFGICHILVFISKNSLFAEIACKHSRGKFLFIIAIPFYLVSATIPLISSLKIPWRISYYVVFGICVLVFVIYYFTFITNPRYLIIHNRLEDAIKNSLLIANVNGMFNNLTEEEVQLKKKEIEELNNNIFNTIHNKENNKENNETEYIEESAYEVDEDNIINKDKTTDTRGSQSALVDKQQTNNQNQSLSLLGFINLTVYFVFASSIMFINNTEMRYYNNHKGFGIFGPSIALLGIPLAFLISYTMNMKLIGRKGNILIITLIMLICRIISLFGSDYDDICFFTFLIEKLMSGIAIYPSTSLITESISNKDRVKLFSRAFFFSKFLHFLIPLIVINLNEYIISGFYIGFCVITIVTLMFIKETRGKEMDDH